jgi:hypothetical protein
MSFPYLWHLSFSRWMRKLYWTSSAFKDSTNFDHIKTHYYWSHPMVKYTSLPVFILINSVSIRFRLIRTESFLSVPNQTFCRCRVIETIACIPILAYDARRDQKIFIVDSIICTYKKTRHPIECYLAIDLSKVASFNADVGFMVYDRSRKTHIWDSSKFIFGPDLKNLLSAKTFAQICSAANKRHSLQKGSGYNALTCSNSLILV